MTLWNYILIGFGLALLVFLLWMELRRRNRCRLTARLASSVLAVGALVCMGLPINCQRGNTVMGKEGVLLTEGYNSDSVREFFRQHAETKVITTDDTVMDRWQVFGYGLTRDEWIAVRPPSMVFHSPAAGTGLISADWQRQLQKGQRLQVQGHWRGKEPVKLLLEGMGQVLDSVMVKGDSLFQLSTVPAHAGRAIYRFVAVGVAADILEQEDIPVEVLAGKPLKILVLASSPDAENTFLMNWLSKDGHAVASRTLVSRDKYQQAYVNTAQRPLGQITPALLTDLDLVIADAQVLTREGLLPMLRRQVEEKGLGLVIKVDSAGGTALGVATGGYLKDQPGLRVLLRDSLGRILVGGNRDGAGKILYTSYNRTYSLVLAGEQQRYATYWSSLLRETAKETEAGEEWHWRPLLPRVRQPVLGVVQTGEVELPQGVIGGRPATVYLAEDGVLPYSWSGRYWPEASGWQTARTLQGDTAWWYVWPADAWTSLYREKRKEETQAFIRETLPRVEARGPGTGTIRDVKGWFYALFLLSVVFLWIERKMSG